jgi:hypothetical protein
VIVITLPNNSCYVPVVPHELSYYIGLSARGSTGTDCAICCYCNDAVAGDDSDVATVTAAVVLLLLYQHRPA